MPIFSKAIDKPLRKGISLVSSSVKDVFVVDALTKLQCSLLCAVTNQLNIVQYQSYSFSSAFLLAFSFFVLFIANLGSLTCVGIIAFYYWIQKLSHSPGMKFHPTPPPSAHPLAVYIMNAALYGVAEKHGDTYKIAARKFLCLHYNTGQFFYVGILPTTSKLYPHSQQDSHQIRRFYLITINNNYLYHFIYPDVLHFPWDLSERSKTLAF